MAFHMPGIVFNSGGSGLVFGAGFVLGSLACLILRLTIDCTHNLRKWGAQDEKVFNMDAAEKGGLKVRTKILLDEDLFSLEKRAFFSQVSPCHGSAASSFQPKKGTREMLASSVSHARVAADDAAVVALRMPS